MQKDGSPKSGTTQQNPARELPHSPAWEAKAEELIERKATGKFRRADHFAGKVFRKQFFPIISRVYIDELIAYSTSKGLLTDERVIVDLGLNASTFTRWVNGTHPPGADKFFAIILLILKRNLNSFPFPDRSELLFRAIQHQLKAFALKYCQPPENPRCELDRLAFRSLIHAMKNRFSDRLIPGLNLEAEIKETALKTVVVAVNQGLKADFEVYRQRRMAIFAQPPNVLPRQITRWLSDWGMAYTLLAFGTKSVLWEIDDAKI